jgi:hypothetical protein
MGVALMACGRATPGDIAGTLPGLLLAGGTKRVVLIDAGGRIVWEHQAALVHDAWMLPGGKILFADGVAVTEVAPDHTVVFQFRPQEQRGGGAYACQRLSDGNTLIGENSTGRILEVDPQGRVMFELQCSPVQAGAHQNMRMARKLDNGNYLVCHSGAHLVKEYARDGKTALELKTPNLAFAAIRTERGTTMVSTLGQVLEYDASGHVVWQFANTDLPGVVITNMTGMHLLPDGNLAVGCYRAYNGRAGHGLFEITRGRKLVWRYADPDGDVSMMAIQRLDGRGSPLPGKCLR